MQIVPKDQRSVNSPQYTLKNLRIAPVTEVAFQLEGVPGAHALRFYASDYNAAGCAIAHGLENIPREVLSEIARQAYAFLRSEMGK